MGQVRFCSSSSVGRIVETYNICPSLCVGLFGNNEVHVDDHGVEMLNGSSQSQHQRYHVSTGNIVETCSKGGAYFLCESRGNTAKACSGPFFCFATKAWPECFDHVSGGDTQEACEAFPARFQRVPCGNTVTVVLCNARWDRKCP